MTATLYGLGVGPGDPELITVKALRLLRAAPVIAYPAPETGDSLARRIAAPHMPADATEIIIRTPMSSDRFPADEVYDRAAAEIGEHLVAGQDVGVLCEGDPFFYGSFMYLYARMCDEFRVEVIPGVSSIMAGSAALGFALASRNDILTVLPGPLEAGRMKERLCEAEAAIILKVGRHFRKIYRVLDDLDLLSRSRYIERATLENQRIAPLEDIDPEGVPYFSMILVHKRGLAWNL
jgi:precorrin-2/cobalt-factor-2 C20-methyltransferase